MKFNKLVLSVLLGVNAVSFSQEIKKEVLFTVDNKPYYTDEFARVYNKNIDLVKDESQKDLNQYLELFVGYKLKINKANKLGLQNDPKYVNELKSYRSQLAKNYTSDTKVTKALIDEAYARMQKEVRASHILIMVDENAAPADSLKAYNEILDLRKRALAGENFGDLAAKYSQDPSAKENKGDLGYFSAFRMVYPFESAAFKTKVGDISMPVRTKFGYHLVKVADLRDNRGEVSVAHIMIVKPKPTGNESADLEKAKNTIKEIYTKLKQGEKFESLAAQFSEDKNSGPRGGVLPKFGSGQLSSEEFENISFGLKNVGDYSEPFETQFGWHIIKLVEKHPIQKLEDLERELENKIRRDDRSRLITNSLNAKLRKKYVVKRNDKVYKQIKTAVTDVYYEGKWVMPADTKDFEKELVKIQDKPVLATGFLRELESQQKSNLKIKPIGNLVDHLYEKFVDNQLNIYYNDNLENEFPEFANVVEEYRDGLLLFDLMEKEIWNKAKQDTLGLKGFYEKNKGKYQWKNRVDVIIASSTKSDFAKKTQKMLQSDATIDAIKEKLNTKEVVNIMAKEETFEEGNEHFPKNVAFKTGVSEVYKDGEFYFVNKVVKTIPAGPKALDETRGRVINDYQQFLEDNWVSELKNEFKIAINQDVFERLKTAMKK
ncbi:peptidylprolyl isomerase [Flavobacterium amniphilum]|uniref:peptidylprolyl isomerase n=1 Tax=Flavobacterium amniphilum TaxID=1834035 RepID=UPI00202A139C|nr:peptidylprolyl isomerase [Flavobacterium amniphilum]MCL9806109.1 peptidylprolyl isomerase [Flavobacterium amniphilum]